MTKKIGITGGIGAGKSLVSKVFGLLGVPLYNADERAKVLIYEPDIKSKIISLLGEESYTPEHIYNKTWVAERVFHRPELLNKLNQIIHPAVGLDFEFWLKEQDKVPYILKEAALLIESGSYRMLDQLIVVTAPEELRITRVCNRDRRSIEQVKAIISKQIPEVEKLKLADFVINNDEKSLVIPKILEIHQRLIS